MKLCDSRAALLFQGCLSLLKHRWGWGAVWDLGTWKRHRHREELRKVRHCEVLVLAGLPCALEGGFSEPVFPFSFGRPSLHGYLTPRNTVLCAACCQGYRELQMCMCEKCPVNNQRFRMEDFRSITSDTYHLLLVWSCRFDPVSGCWLEQGHFVVRG